jgi:hypothetical protein
MRVKLLAKLIVFLFSVMFLVPVQSEEVAPQTTATDVVANCLLASYSGIIFMSLLGLTKSRKFAWVEFVMSCVFTAFISYISLNSDNLISIFSRKEVAAIDPNYTLAIGLISIFVLISLSLCVVLYSSLNAARGWASK